MAQGTKKTPEQYRKEIRALYGKSLIVLEDYKGAHGKIQHRCTVCDYVSAMAPTNLIKFKRKCRSCFGRKPWSQEEYVEALRERNIEVTGMHKNQRTPVSHRCGTCSYEWDALPCNVVDRGTGCPACAHETRNTSFAGKKTKLNGKVYKLQGFEKKAVDYLVSKGANVKKLAVRVSDGKPTVNYRDGDKTRLYIPDFYYPPKNRIIEVKSIWTLAGKFKNGVDMFRLNKLKARACRKAGFDFCMLVLNGDGSRMVLPANWERMTRHQLYRAVGYRTHLLN